MISESAKRKNAKDYHPCTEITAFEVATGKKLWSKHVEVSGTEVQFKEATISATTLAVGGGYNGGAAFNLASGKVLWQPKVGNCEDEGYAGGEQLVAVRKCGDYGNERYSVQLLNSKSGAVKWEYKLPAGIDNAKVISTKPVVFGVDSGEITASGVTDVFSLDDKGELRTKITLADGKYEHDCGVNMVEDCHAIAVGNDKLYVPTKQHDGSGDFSRTNEIIAFSLATGKTTGDKIDAGDGYDIFPIRMDGDNVLAFKDGPYDKGAQVVSVDGTSLKETKLLETPASESVIDAISSMVPKTSEMLYTDGKLFLGKDLVNAAVLGRREGVHGARLRRQVAREARAAARAPGPAPVEGRGFRAFSTYRAGRPRGRDFGKPGSSERQGERNVEQACSFREQTERGCRAGFFLPWGSMGIHSGHPLGDWGDWGVARWECG